MTRVADTSFLITLFDERDPRHALACEIAEEPEPIVVPLEVLGETLGVVHLRRGFDVARAIWADLGKIPHMEFLETGEGAATAEIFAGANGALSWVDSAVVARCKMLGASPLCYDDDILAAVAGRSRKKRSSGRST
ncbi:MAG: PIN domain-containing protein [Euryarchaeota archaeon]|nr:PIN domain-containing protein [Euryarchaeota archaeon]